MHAACEGGKCQWSTTWHTNTLVFLIKIMKKNKPIFNNIWKFGSLFVKKKFISQSLELHHDHKYFDRTEIIPVKCNTVVGIKLPPKISQILAQTSC